ncbi:hypothetical protein ACT7V1_001940 [Salmonella enterica subsp. enterica]|uniref:hypothetical protein n=1 Tax=Citrobacter portucalensis TaxID=1639133 RepID=UPI00107DBCCE|nr:hypothetical protein [Citrobacter portucalensis]EAA7021867.1 hypothetical protein [Salmonella enterica subsp. enterica serovar Durham]EBM5748412.1 hypothetical protein [Salmonella enterica]ECF5807435.1 hypothetical protein [Salmonella enterica subsp. enterica serovar Bahati]EDQ7230800.1 hypothetical protein [Salmonella enterica subsp. enterica]ECG3768092.1 hypothetical protein [Salmonella enterica subsp. enterica serovar Durham]
MKYTKKEYIKLGRTLQKSIAEYLPGDVIKYTIIAIKYADNTYKAFYEVRKCYDRNPYESETITHDIREFNSYSAMLNYLLSIGFQVEELNTAKGLKIQF